MEKPIFILNMTLAYFVPFENRIVQTYFKGADFTKKQGLIRSSMILMTAVFVGKATGLVFKIFLANILGGTGMGYFSSAYAVYTPLYALCAASLTPAVAQLVSENDARGNPGRVRGVKSAALRIFTLPSLLCSFVPMAFAGFITRRFIGNENAKYAVIAILPCVFLTTVTAIYRGYYEGLRNMLPTAISQITESLVRVTAGIGFAYGAQIYARSCFVNGRAVFGVFPASEAEFYDVSLPYIAAAAIAGVTVSEFSSFLFMLLRHRLGSDGIKRDIRPKKYETKSEGKRLLAIIAPVSAAAIVSSLAGTVDLYTIILCIKSSLARHPELYAQKYADIISGGVAMKDLPNYLYGSFTGLAATVFGLAPSLCSVFGKSALPAISESWARQDKIRTSQQIRRVMTLILYISVPAGLGLSAMSRDILGLLFSSRVNEVAISAAPLSVLAVGTAFATAEGAAYAMLQAVGRADMMIKINLAGAFIKLALNTVLVPVPQLGLVGAALASLISEGIMCIWAVSALYRITATKPRLFISLACPVIIGLLSVFSALKIYNVLSYAISGALRMVISLSFAVISYIIFVLLLDISTKNKILSAILEK